MKLSDLNEQREAILARMRDAHAADNTEAFTAAETEHRAIEGKIERAKALADAERRMTGTPVAGDGRTDTFLKGQNVRETLLYGMGETRGIDIGKVQEEQAELARRSGKTPQGVQIYTGLFEKRAITSTTPATGPGGNLIPTDHMAGEYINALMASTVISSLGARTLSGLIGNVDIPGEKAAPSVAWVAENAAITASDAQFRTVSLTPKHVGSLSEFSRNMLLQSSPDIEALLRQMMARDIALEIDRAAISGAVNGPTGLLATSGVQTQAYTASLFHTAAEMIAKANTANAGDRRSFLTTNVVLEIGLKAKNTTDFPLSMDEVFHSYIPTFSNLVPSNLGSGTNESALIYGDWSELLIGIWSALDVLVNPYAETAYNKGNVMVRTMATVDVAVRHPEAFVKANIPANAVAIAA